MDDDNPKSIQDLKFGLEPVPEPLELKHFYSPANLSPLEIRITAEQEIGQCFFPFPIPHTQCFQKFYYKIMQVSLQWDICGFIIKRSFNYMKKTGRKSFEAQLKTK